MKNNACIHLSDSTPSAIMEYKVDFVVGVLGVFRLMPELLFSMSSFNTFLPEMLTFKKNFIYGFS